MPRCFALACCLGALLCAGCVFTRPIANERLREGDAALASRNYALAVAEFREAVRLDPTFAEGHYKLGLAQKESGNLEEAASALQEAVRLDPNNAAPLFEFGEVLRLLQRSAQAIRAYVMACELEPRNFDYRFRLASAYHQSGDFEQAIAEYERALGLRPQDAFVYSNLGAALAALGRDYEAIRAYKQSLEADEAQPIVLVNLATVYLNQERWDTARRTLEAAIERHPDLSPAHERMGYTLWRMQDLLSAAASYRRAIQLDPRNSAARAGYGVVLMTQYLDDPSNVSLRDEAVESWHRSLELDPNQPKLRELVEKYRPKAERPPLQFEN
ncbi:MAG: tetratricopeptide repeat protein [Phycisphaerales bacterium]|nr:tetratricopeptide repeat protein [Phycisphaerales bacterium]